MENLYGDGIHDDYQAIQALLDSRVCEVVLPAPKKHYLISKTLKIHGNQTLVLPKFATIRLTDGADCEMIENADFSVLSENIRIDGGIWDMNHSNQSPNPFHFEDKYGKKLQDYLDEDNFSPKTATQFTHRYTGHCMRFCRVKNLHVTNVTIKNPVVFGVQVAYLEEFSFTNIQFDYTEGSPKLWNMDGIHIEGHCKNGFLQNLKGTCHDDLVAITADDSLYGPIENITVDGIYAEHAHSAVRLLSHGLLLKNIHISNVYGSYYVYCIGLTRYWGDENERGCMQNIVIDNVFVEGSEGTVDVKGGCFPVIWVQSGLDVENLSLTNVFRNEKTLENPFMRVDENATIKNLVLNNVTQRNYTDKKVPFLVLDGKIENLVKNNVFEF